MCVLVCPLISLSETQVNLFLFRNRFQISHLMVGVFYAGGIDSVSQYFGLAQIKRPMKNMCFLFKFYESLAVSLITWKKFQMIYRIASCHNFSQTTDRFLQRDQLTNKPSSMTSCRLQVTTVLAHLLDPRNPQGGSLRAVSLNYLSGFRYR